MDPVDRQIINTLQGGFPISERPYAEFGEYLGISEEELIQRLKNLLAQGFISRFAPLYHTERLGGGVTLAAMQVPAADFERVAEQINILPEIAHNYARDHWLNMWFVIATEHPEQIAQVIRAIEQQTGLPVYNFPKLTEYYLEFKICCP